MEYIPTEQEEMTNDLLPNAVVIQPGDLIVLSKTNAQEFHQKMREMILDTGVGLWEYLEVLKFFENVNKYVKGDSQSKIPEDKEFVQFVRDELSKYEKGKHTSARGVRFELAETGHKWNYDDCNDVELTRKESEMERLKEWIDNRKEMLKTLKQPTILVDAETGEGYTVDPPTKTSKSSYKISLAK